MDKLEKQILSLIRKHKKLTTYEIAKKLGVSWQTAQLRIYKLFGNGKIDMVKERKGALEKVYWVKK